MHGAHDTLSRSTCQEFDLLCLPIMTNLEKNERTKIVMSRHSTAAALHHHAVGPTANPPCAPYEPYDTWGQ